jgi:predicted nucleotidyltransferase
MSVRIHVDRSRLAEFCRRHHIRHLAFFGSVVRDDFRPDSDVDVLYEFVPGHEPGWDIASIEDELAALLGRRVDLVPFKYLNPHIRDQVLAEAETQYAA